MSNKLLFNAATSRFLLAAYVLVLMPELHPGLANEWPWVAAYLLVVSAEQWLIWRGLGGQLRPIVGGIVDLIFITALVHWVGSVTTVLVALYFFACIVNMLVVSSRTGMWLTAFGAALYAMVVMLAATGTIAYGPHAPAGLIAAPPTFVQGVLASGTTATLLGVSGLIVGMLVSTNREREEALLDANARLETLSSHDTLTSLLNRRALIDQLGIELDALSPKRPLALAMLDLDKFKRINDERGHADGDALLVRIAHTLRESARDMDVVARFGGDEFLVLYPHTNMDDALVGAQRLVGAVRALGVSFDPERPVTVSVGLAAARVGDTAVTLLRRADEAAYRAKREGGDQVVPCAS
ncbi:MAG: GGDEF domain-containing protein [Polyangiales bacterium]|nr:GGDEF domain-containing protein [Myxococcales bacterium]